MLVQIAIEGQYRENYGAHDWDGKGECPQYWKCKGGSTLLVACNVPLTEMPAVIAEIRANMQGLSYSDDYSECIYSDVVVMPNKLAQREFVEWEYAAYDDIHSIPREELQRFLRCFGMEKETEAA